MHLYEQDKAIEFNALYKRLKRRIKNLEQAEINVQSEKESIENIYRSCNESVPAGAVQVQAETTYQEGIKRLEEIEKSLDEHTLYYDSYTSAVDLETKLDATELNKEKLSVLATSSIALINQIQNSDTRNYDLEKNVVERIYRLAYNVMQTELIKEGHSNVLDYVKNDNTAASYINSLIEMDIALIGEEKFTNDVIKDTLSAIKRDIKNGSYLDEGLILFIALQKEQNISKIESSLLGIIKDITATHYKVEASKEENNNLQSKIDSLTKTIKHSKIYKELGLTISLIAILVGLKYGAEKTAAFIGHKEYKTAVDYYSTEKDAKTPEYPEYMPKIANFGKTTLTAYDVWSQENIFYGEYQRDIITYDLSNVDLDALENYMELDFSELSGNPTTETRDEIDVNELYDKAIVEITRFTQSENDSVFVPNENAKNAFLVIVSIVLVVGGAIGGIAIIRSIINKMKISHQSKIAKKETSSKLIESLEAYKQLCNENEEFKNKFLTMYQKFAKFIKNPTIEEEYKKILKKQK